MGNYMYDRLMQGDPPCFSFFKRYSLIEMDPFFTHCNMSSNSNILLYFSGKVVISFVQTWEAVLQSTIFLRMLSDIEDCNEDELILLLLVEVLCINVS